MDVISSPLDISPAILSAARCLWDYLQLQQPLEKSDCLIALGSHDLRVAHYAARLMRENWAPLMVCSGGLGRLTRSEWDEPEAAKFARIARQAGVEEERILLETRSSNTGENICFTWELLESKGMHVGSAILVHKPYMERRAYATAMNYWPDVRFIAASPPIPFEEYPTEEIPVRMVIEIMVGDFQRLSTYARLGYQIPQYIPAEADAAFNTLLRAGFTRFAQVG